MRYVRAAIRLSVFVAWTLAIFAVFYGARIFVPNKTYWRQVIFGLWTRGFARISRMTIEVAGLPPRPPFFLVTNHLSYTDIALIRAVVPSVFVAKSEVEGWFMAGPMCRAMGTIFIDRSNRRDIPRAGELIVERLNAGEGVTVFPEGTSTKGETVLPFNSSFFAFASKSDIPVSYAAISYRTPEGEMPASRAVCWWEDIGFMAHLWRLFKVREYTATLNFGDESITDPDRKTLARELRSSVLERFTPVE